MKVSELIKKLNLDLLTDSGFEDREVSGCYIGDLLSHVMGKASEGDAWITIMSNVNILAVASLADTAWIVLAEGVTVDDEVKKTALDKEINILTTDMDIYNTAVYLNGII